MLSAAIQLICFVAFLSCLGVGPITVDFEWRFDSHLSGFASIINLALAIDRAVAST